MKELEVLVKILEPRSKVLRLVKKSPRSEMIDTYYFSGKLPKKMTECLRVRNILTDDGYTLTYKKDHFRGSKWLYADEYEVKTDKKIGNVLSCLGYRPLIKIEVIKYFYKSCEIQDVKNLGLFLECEDKTRARIWKTIKATGIKVGEELNKGKPQMMIEK